MADADIQIEVAHAPPPAAAELAAERANLCALPAFDGDRPAAWFGHLDAVFEANRISRSRTKFWQAASKIPAACWDTYTDIQATANTADDPYGALKERLTESYGITPQQKMDAFINPSLGCDKPSVLLARMYAMKPDQHDLLHALFLQALPAHCVEAALSTKWEGRQQLGKLCDDIWARKGGAAGAHAALAAAAYRPTSPGRHGSSPGRSDRRGSSPSQGGGNGRSDRPSRRRGQTPGRTTGDYPDENGLCYFHATYGSRARNCRKPCTFQGNGKAGGGN